MDKDQQKQLFLKVFETLKKDNKILGVNDFAKKCDYLQSSISMILSGERNPPTKLLHKICDTFLVSRGYLFEGKGKMFTDGTDKPIGYDANALELKELEILHLKEINQMLKDENEYLKRLLNPKIKMKSKT